MSRGGRRQGTPGKTYSVFRPDLNQNYAPSTPPNPLPPVGSTAANLQTGPQVAQPTQTAAAPAGPPPPGSLNTFGPTARPDEPLTHGLPSGPGGGPEVLAPPQFQPDPVVQASALLSSIPAVHQTPALRALSAALSASVANGTQTSIAQGA